MLSKSSRQRKDNSMLVLSRRPGDSVAIGDRLAIEHAVKVTVLEIRGVRVKLGFEGGTHIAVHRWEVWERICSENLAASLLPDALKESTDCWDDDGGRS
jgi:carbon storage regulator CsrA